jgi:hypothetical protein
MKLDIDQKIVNSVRYLLSEKHTDAKDTPEEYLEELNQGLSPDRAQLLIDLIKERLYEALEIKVKELFDSKK